MAASSVSYLQLLALLALSTGSLFFVSNAAGSDAGAPAASPSGPLNLTAILEKGGQFTTLIRLLNETQVGTQVQNQLNNSYGGLTIFAPTDNAFNNLKPGTLNGLSTQDQVSLVLYHVLPRYYRFDMFQTVSNPIRTQASQDTLNITSTANQANVSTGVVDTRLNTAIYDKFPLAVYTVDVVLLPYSLFGAKAPAEAPSSESTSPPSTGGKARSNPVASAPGSSADSSSPSAANYLQGRTHAGWRLLVGTAALASLMNMLW